VKVRFFGDVSEHFANAVEIRFTCHEHLARQLLEFSSVLWSEEEEEKKPELIKELENIVKKYFDKYETVWIDIYRIEEVC
jgi:hypothetical protein